VRPEPFVRREILVFGGVQERTVLDDLFCLDMSKMQKTKIEQMAETWHELEKKYQSEKPPPTPDEMQKRKNRWEASRKKREKEKKKTTDGVFSQQHKKVWADVEGKLANAKGATYNKTKAKQQIPTGEWKIISEPTGVAGEIVQIEVDGALFEFENPQEFDKDTVDA